MRREILDRLSEITPEERRILNAEPLDMSNYNQAGDALVDPGKMLPGGEMFGIRTHTRFTDFPRHGHRYVEMVYQAQGQTVHILNGVTELVLETGHLLLLGRGTEHEIKAAGMEDIAINFFLIPAFFDNAAISLGENGALAVFLRGNLKNTRLLSGHLLFDVAGEDMIENLLENLVLGQFQGVSQRIQQMTLELLLQHLSRMPENLIVHSQTDQEQAIVLKVLAQIESQVRVNLSEVARSIPMDVTVLSRLIQKYTGCTFTELLHTARFNRAVTLLRETSLSVTDIATSIGYENTAFFYRRFAQIYGCTPAEYRKQHRTEPNRI